MDRRRAARLRLRMGATTRTPPSVETSSSVSASISRASSRGLSTTSAKLFPERVSFFLVPYGSAIPYARHAPGGFGFTE